MIGHFVDNAIDYTILAAAAGVKLAAKLGDRLLGGGPFNEREAQRFLTMGGAEGSPWPSPDQCRVCGSFGYCYMPDRCPKSADALADVEAEREVLEPGDIPNDAAYALARFGDRNADVHLCTIWRDGKCHCLMSVQLSDGSIYTDYIDNAAQAEDVKRAHDTMASVCRALDDLGVTDHPVGTIQSGLIRVTPSNPADVGADPGIGGADSAPGSHSGAPVECEAPGPSSTHPPCVDPGHPTSIAAAYQKLDRSRSEHPLYADIQDAADAAVVADVLAGHRCYYDDITGMFECHAGGSPGAHAAFGTTKQWIAHISPLIVQALQQ